MSSAAVHPTQAAASAAGSTPTPEPAASAVAASPAAAAASDGADPSTRDYLGKVRAGGDFATSEVTKHQSRADQLEARLRKAGDLVGWAEQVGPETIQRAVERYSALRTDPRFGKIIQQYETTGEIPKSNGYDSYDEPEPEDPKDIQIRQLQERVAAQEVSGGAQAMQAHVEKFFKDIPLPQAVRERASEKAMAQIKQWHQLGGVGIKSIQNLQTPQGYDTVKSLLLSQLSSEEILQAGRDAFLRNRGEVARFATDVPSGIVTTGREIPPGLKSPLQALQWAKENPEKY